MKIKTRFQVKMHAATRGVGLLICALLFSAFVSCQAETPQGLLRIGLPEEPRTLNLWLASDANSRKILSQIYQPLYIRHPKTLKLIPWLAAGDPIYDKEKITLCSSGVSIFLMAFHLLEYLGTLNSLMISPVNTTSSAVKSEPSAHLAFLSLTVYEIFSSS